MQQEITRVALDAMGGDNAPGELVKGAVDAVNGRSDIKVLLVGQQDVVKKELKQYSYPKEQIEVVHAEEVIEMRGHHIWFSLQRWDPFIWKMFLELRIQELQL